MIWYVEGTLHRPDWYSHDTWIVGYAPSQAEAEDTAKRYEHSFKLAIRSVAHLYKPARKQLERYHRDMDELDQNVYDWRRELFRRYLALADVYTGLRDLLFKRLEDPNVLAHADRSLHRIMKVTYVVKSLKRLGAEGADDDDRNVALAAAHAADGSRSIENA